MVIKVRTLDPMERVIAANIREFRWRKRLSQKELGQHLGIKANQICGYEKGDYSIRASRLYRVALALNTPLGAFFDDPEQDVDLEAPRTTAELAALVNMLPEEKRMALLRLVRAMVDEDSPQEDWDE